MLVVGLAGCGVLSPERERIRFDCGGTQLIVSTQQRMPTSLGGEEYVYVRWTAGTGASIKREIDNNGRWTERLGASVAEDGSWVRFHLRHPFAAPETVTRDRYSYLAYIELRTGEVVRFAIPHSTKEEREGGLFASSPELAAEQTLRGRQVRWRPCR